jgi:hypothetical protein
MSERSVAPACAVLLGALGSMLPGWARVPILLYDPIGRSLRWGRIGSLGGTPVEITFYGVYLLAAACALVGALIGFALERRGIRPRLLPAWALTSLVVAASYQAWTIWP